MYQTYSTITAGNYSAPLLLGISKASLLGGRHATPAYAAVTDWDRDTTFTLAPSLTQVSCHPSWLCAAHVCTECIAVCILRLHGLAWRSTPPQKISLGIHGFSYGIHGTS